MKKIICMLIITALFLAKFELSVNKSNRVRILFNKQHPRRKQRQTMQLILHIDK
jgi:Mg2+/Co2+ transporter CorB